MHVAVLKEADMRNRLGLTTVTGACRLLVAVALVVASAIAARAQSPTLEQLLSGVVHVKTLITPDGRTTENLGREREGTGIVIDDNGLVLTIGYLMVEAISAEITTNDGRTVGANVVGYDNESGFGLLQTITPLKVRALQMGKASDIKAWSGAALVGHDGKLVGVGSLIVNDASGNGDNQRGNMFVPIDRLSPILADLISDGRPAVARPWLGINTDDVGGHLVVSRVTSGAPAEKAGVRKGDIILAVNGETPKGLPDFYRKIWSQGAAGADIPLDVLHNHERRTVQVHSINRLDLLKLKSTF
jgi:S1-C subfamily serine protease